MNLCRYQAPGFVEAVFLGFLRHRGCDSGGGLLDRDGVLCGRYDALDNEWWEQPAQSFTEWFYAMAAPRQNNAQPVHPRLPNTTASAPSH